MKIEFHRHSLEQVDIDNVCRVLRSIFLTTGPVTAEFERRFSGYTGLRHTVALNSCTAALHLALLALDIGPGDEVITTPMTFIATATAIMHTGATPVFVDVENNTGLLDVGRVEHAITPRTKAVLPVHLYGAMVNMRSLREMGDRYKLSIIEDCAHCIEGERDDVRPGQLSDAACYSFYATKNLTCGEGGALATNDAGLAERVNILKLHGMSKDAASRYSGPVRDPQGSRPQDQARSDGRSAAVGPRDAHVQWSGPGRHHQRSRLDRYDGQQGVRRSGRPGRGPRQGALGAGPQEPRGRRAGPESRRLP
ncbi:MAG: DegT/DnrJ/EryC1/StrS aminotransferase family protein [Desulfobacteraceae bacterium]|nr:MAG: DegT/DnrJ/EryC1/StrS aminotransferase family protein [Desulfobacteraceae bacterium]